MKKKPFILIFGVLILIIDSIFLFWGLNNKNTDSKSQQLLDPEIRERMTEEQKRIADASLQEPKVRNDTISKINRSLKEGNLTKEEAVKLRLTALIQPEELPKSYKGESPKGH